MNKFIEDSVAVVFLFPLLSRASIQRRFQFSEPTKSMVKEDTGEGRIALFQFHQTPLMSGIFMRIAGDGPFTKRPMGQVYRSSALEPKMSKFVSRFSQYASIYNREPWKAVAHLKQIGAILHLMIDIHNAKGLITHFLGRQSSTSHFGGVLLKRFKAKAYVLRVEHTGFFKGIFHLECLETIRDGPSSVFAVNQWLEEKLLHDMNFAENWMWIHNRWKAKKNALGISERKNAFAEQQAWLQTHNKTIIPARATSVYVHLPREHSEVLLVLPFLKAIQNAHHATRLVMVHLPQFSEIVEEHLPECTRFSIPKIFKGRFYKKIRLDYPEVSLILNDSVQDQRAAGKIMALRTIGLRAFPKSKKWFAQSWKPKVNPSTRQAFWNMFFEDIKL